MIKLVSPFRPATPEDASALAELANIAGDGLPLYVWTGLAQDGESPWETGRQRARRESGSFSYRNAVVHAEAGRIAACLIGYRLPDRPSPIDPASMPAMFVPLQELENLASGTWYVNVVASFPEYRGRGIGTSLLGIAEELAVAAGCPGLSLVVSNANRSALRLYERLGYVQKASRPLVREGWSHDGTAWLLLVRRF